jgi:hypothetical protein
LGQTPLLKGKRVFSKPYKKSGKESSVIGFFVSVKKGGFNLFCEFFIGFIAQSLGRFLAFSSPSFDILI